MVCLFASLLFGSGHPLHVGQAKLILVPSKSQSQRKSLIGRSIAFLGTDIEQEDSHCEALRRWLIFCLPCKNRKRLPASPFFFSSLQYILERKPRESGSSLLAHFFFLDANDSWRRILNLFIFIVLFSFSFLYFTHPDSWVVTTPSTAN